MTNKPKESVRLLSDHLQTNPRRKLGAQNGPLVECKRSKHHGHHPAGELCPVCEPAAVASSAPKCLGQRYYEWWVADAGAVSMMVAEEWHELESASQLRWQSDAERYISLSCTTPDWADDGEIDFGWPG